MDSQFDIWLNRLNLDQYAEIFRENDIDFDSVRLLTDSDLKEMGMSLGHRRRLLAAVGDLQTSTAASSTGSDGSDLTGVSLGERRQLTVMFCDIVGSTRLAQEIDPEDLREIILQFQNFVVAAVNKYGGFVAKFLGDGALCYFGWPQAFEDQAERAVRAAMDALGDIQSIRTQQKKKLQVRIGIETGEVVFGDLIGNSSTEERAIVGETPNLASRLQSSAKAGQIIIGPVTRDMLGTTFELKDLGPQKLKGFAERVNTWQVLRESDAVSRFDAIRGSQSSPIAGRELELKLLNQFWDPVQQGEGQTVLVSGEAGIGKSRLISEFSGGYSDKIDVFRFQCAPLHVNNAFFPIKQYFRLNAQILQTDPDEVKFEKLNEFLDSLPLENSETVPIFSRLLGINKSHKLPQSEHTPGQFRDEVVQNTTRLITEKASGDPIMVIVEDTHWADPSTRQFIKHFTNQVHQHRILLLISYRPEDKSNWKDVKAQLGLELEGLGTNEAQTVVESISLDQLDGAVVEQIINRSDGNPLCLEELTKTLLGSSQPNEDVSNEVLIPATLQSSLIARIDQLNTAKEVAQIGAVIGQSFRFDLLKQISGKPDDEIMRSMDQLVSSGLIHRRINNENTYFVFKHALVHDAAYSTILRARRKTLHHQIVEILEREGEDLDRPQLNLLAHHALNSENWAKALQYNREAAAHALGQSALHEAVGYLKHAIVALRNHEQSDEHVREAINIRLELRNALWAVGANDEILDQLNEAEQAAKSIKDETSLAWIAVYRGASQWLIGRNEEARSSTELAVSLSRDMDNFSLKATANFYRGCVDVQSGNYAGSLASFRQISEALSGEDNYKLFDLPFAPSVVSRSWLVWSLAEIGSFNEGIVEGQEGEKIAETIEHPFSHAHILYDIGYLHIVRQDFEAAIEVLNRARALTQHWKLGNLDLFTIGFLGYAKFRAGEPESGLALLEECLGRYQALGSGLFHTLALLHLSEVHQSMGDLDKARDHAEQALKIIETRGEQGHLAYGQLRLGQIASVNNSDPDLAHELVSSALKIAKDLSMKPLQFHCSAELAEISQTRGVTTDSKKYKENCAELREQLGVNWPVS